MTERKSVNDPETQKKYYRKWYKANRKKLAAKRKEKYHNDAEYRAKARAQAREGMRRQRERRQREQAEGGRKNDEKE